MMDSSASTLEAKRVYLIAVGRDIRTQISNLHAQISQLEDEYDKNGDEINEINDKLEKIKNPVSSSV
jgi:peptidoglycan hydrolase CwlO-like protein